jgi:hypothetical protein
MRLIKQWLISCFVDFKNFFKINMPPENQLSYNASNAPARYAAEAFQLIAISFEAYEQTESVYDSSGIREG